MSQAPRPRAEQRVDFFIAGGQKCGTTALHRMLKRHPDVQLSRPKEAHFFDQEAHGPKQARDWDNPDYEELHARFRDWSVQKLRGESTPIYTYWPNAIERIHDYNPDARIIMALRQPALRAYSHWRMAVSLGIETLSFSEAIRSGRSRVGDRHRRQFSYVERGFYAEQAARLLRVFGREQVHFLRTDELWSEPDQVFTELLDFLGLPHRQLTTQPEYIIPYRARMTEADPLDPADRAMLTELYADNLRETASLTGLELEDWLDPGYREPMAKVS